jgi:hypothetical protein
MPKVEEISLKQRAELAGILNPQSAGDALASHFALEHPGNRVRIFVSKTSASRIAGFLVKAWTGYDLFQPLLVPFTASGDDLNALLEAALFDTPQALIGMPYEHIDQLEAHYILNQPKLTEILRLDPSKYRQIINVLVLAKDTPDGWPRFEVKRGETTLAATGMNWLGKRFAEIYFNQLPGLTQDFAPSLLSAISSALLERRRVALLRIGEAEDKVFTAAEEVGFRATGIRTVFGTISK